MSIYGISHDPLSSQSFFFLSFILSNMHFPMLPLALAAIVSVGAHPFLCVSDVKRACQMVHKPKSNPNLRYAWPGPLHVIRVATLNLPSAVVDLAGCVKVCHDTTGCISFGFASNSQSCQLYSTSLLTMNIASPNSTVANSTTYYNTGCCQKQCAPVPQSCICTRTFRR